MGKIVRWELGLRGLSIITCAPRGRGVNHISISIAYYIQKGGGVQIAKQIANLINGRSLNVNVHFISHDYYQEIYINRSSLCYNSHYIFIQVSLECG